MAKQSTDREVKALMRKPGVTRVSPGLYLRVRESGAAYWMYRYTKSGSSHEISLGPTYVKTLAEARAEAEALRVARYKGGDPVQERRRAKVPTFDECATDYIKANRAAWKNEKHAAQWQSTLNTYATPIFGSQSVGDINTSLVLKVFEKDQLWTTKAETASRLRGRIEAVLDWAKVRGYRSGENPARWKGHLDKLLPKRSKLARVQHHAALPYAQIGKFMSALHGQEGMGARALEFAILTAARSGEVRGAKWSEIDQDGRLWIVPAERMKAGKEHHVPLSNAVVALLERLPRIEGTDLLFPNTKGDALSDMTLTAVIRRMNEGETPTWTNTAGETITAHGFRSTFRDWAGETTAYPREVIEHALAHQLKDKAEAAYQRGSLLQKRRALMDDWGDQAMCSNLKPAATSSPLTTTIPPIRSGVGETPTS